ncbi:MauE/DoxX family redox-associated membrane protein [Actinokineospora terrae]|uniref:Methylamine utilisation protein MauE domain-containing protein n=1 Tax=Actinokineospora terrae TaxID=155974 RepID=A0A1H9X6C3_9PSEU|nr:MauE/DoxX family redox-associated membrane protein [Actinokineospora terrae]SES41601.1 hypothetical protein SAMN04487818_11319 [Actinokineospora terrae]
MLGTVAAGGAILLLLAAFDHRWLAAVELTVAASVFLTPYAVVALYAAFTFYLVDRKRRHPGTPCGCFRGEGPVTWLVVIRAAFFAVGAALEPEVPVALALAGGFVLAMVWWLLPQLTSVVRQPLGHTRAVKQRQ